MLTAAHSQLPGYHVAARQRRRVSRVSRSAVVSSAVDSINRRSALAFPLAAATLALPAHAYSTPADAVGKTPLICGSFPPGYELPPQVISSQSADYANKLYLRYLVPKLVALLDGLDAKDAWRLSLMDAGTGKVDGSIRFELDRPYAKGLKPIVARYEKAKKAIDADLTTPLTYADLYALGGKVVANGQWRRDYAGETDRFAKGAYKGTMDDDQFDTAFGRLYTVAALGAGGTPILLGRKDATEASSAEAAARIPYGSSDPIAYKEWFLGLGLKFLDVNTLCDFVDDSGACRTAMATDDTYRPFLERNDKDSLFPGLVEKRLVTSYSNVMAGTGGPGGGVNRFFYPRPAFVKNGGWSGAPPIKDLDAALINPMINSQEALDCVPIEAA